MNKLAIASMLVVAVAVVLYAHTVNFAFVWDDGDLIRHNAKIHPPAPLIESVVENSHLGIYWRPLVMLSFAIDWRLSGGNPAMFHITQILLHALVTLLLLFWIYIITKDPLLSSLAALLFAVHPMASETVCFISARDNLLMFIGVELAGIGYFLWKESGRWLFVAMYLFGVLLAIGTKESGLIAGVIPLIDFGAYVLVSRRNEITKPLVWFAGFAVVFSGLLLVVRMYLQSKIVPPVEDWNFLLPPIVAIKQFGFRMAFFAGKLLLPVGSNPDYYFGFERISNMELVVGYFFFAALIALGYIVVHFGRRDLLFFLLLFVVYVLPFATVLNPPGRTFSESWLYPIIPTAAVAFAVGLLELQRRISAVLFYVLVFVVIFGMAAGAYGSSQKWQNNRTLFDAALRADPDNPRALISKARKLIEVGRFSEAYPIVMKALSSAPNDPYAFEELAFIALNTGKVEQAKEFLQEGIRRAPWYKRNMGLLAAIAISEKRYDDAIKILKKIPQYHFTFTARDRLLGIALYKSGKREEGLRILRDYLKRHPEDETARKFLQEVMWNESSKDRGSKTNPANTTDEQKAKEPLPNEQRPKASQ